MTWASVILAFFEALGIISSWLRERQLLDAGVAQAIAAAMELLNDRVAKARAARAAAAAGGMPDDGTDPYRRD